MSANIYYEPVNPGKDLGINTPSSFMEIFSRCFGEFPLILETHHIGKLEGISAASTPEIAMACHVLIENILKYHKVRVWAEY